MAASANHIEYEGIIVNARNIDGRLTLIVANTKEEPKESDTTVRVKLDRDQTDTVKSVLYLGSLIYVEGRLEADEQGLFIAVSEMKYKKPHIDMNKLK
ncbi:MAG: hypothetical protein ACI4NB_11810 [Candidatus Ornithospirochaeta sp.]